MHVKKALELGVDGIEIDVFVCASGELVVFHDKTLDKLTDATGYIEAIDLDSIRKITVLDRELIPTLEEVLETINAKAVLVASAPWVMAGSINCQYVGNHVCR